MKIFGRKVPFLEKLFNIYVKENNLDELEKLISELTLHYEKNGVSLERIYRLAHDKLSHFETSFKLGEILASQGKKEESLRIYYDLSLQVYNKREIEKVSRCLKAMDELRSISLLSPFEQQSLLMQRYTVELFQQIQIFQEMQKHTIEFCREFSQAFQQIKTTQQSQQQSIESIQKQLQKVDANSERSTQQLQSIERKVEIVQKQSDPNKHGEGLNRFGRGIELIHAATSGNLEKIRNILLQDTDVNTVNHLGESPLSCAVKNQHLEVAKLLIANGSFVMHEQWDKEYALAQAKESGSKLWQQEFRYPSLEKRFRLKQIPLALAVKNKNFEMVKLLIEHKAIVCSNYSNDRTRETFQEEEWLYNFLDYALNTGSFEILHYLFVNSYLNQESYWRDCHERYGRDGHESHERYGRMMYDALNSAIKCKFIKAIQLFVKQEEFRSYCNSEAKRIIDLYKVANLEIMEIFIENKIYPCINSYKQIIQNAIQKQSVEQFPCILKAWKSSKDYNESNWMMRSSSNYYDILKMLGIAIDADRFDIFKLLKQQPETLYIEIEILDNALQQSKREDKGTDTKSLKTIRWLLKNKQIDGIKFEYIKVNYNDEYQYERSYSCGSLVVSKFTGCYKESYSLIEHAKKQKVPEYIIDVLPRKRS